MNSIDPVELMKRQYLQLSDPDELGFPPQELLRWPGTQAQIYDAMFNESSSMYLPPKRYRFRVLKRIVSLLEQAIQDPEEDEISDDISSCLAQYMAQPLPSASVAAQQKSYVTYTVPLHNPDAPHITLLETPSLIASLGTTGFRTWEAALFLGTYLFTIPGSRFVKGQNVLELGAGTGFLSILCAKHLGARHVLATDGSDEVIIDLKANLHLNGLSGTELIQIATLQWGHTLINSVVDCGGENRSYDLVVGADVTYDLSSIQSLVVTMRDLFQLYPIIKILVSATVRNKETLEAFMKACRRYDFTLERLSVLMPEKESQIGFFFPTSTKIEIYLITQVGNNVKT